MFYLERLGFNIISQWIITGYIVGVLITTLGVSLEYGSAWAGKMIVNVVIFIGVIELISIFTRGEV